MPNADCSALNALHCRITRHTRCVGNAEERLAGRLFAFSIFYLFGLFSALLIDAVVAHTAERFSKAVRPYNYQTGSVWPHDNAIIAMGFKRYGFTAEAARIAHDVSIAASHFRLNQLPELYTAFKRDDTNFRCSTLARTCPKHVQPVQALC
jgi:hypothetical protein